MYNQNLIENPKPFKLNSFKSLCCKINQELDTQLEVLNKLRNILYNCTQLNAKPLCDSTFDRDIYFILGSIIDSNVQHNKEILKKAINTLNIYKHDFIVLNNSINTKLREKSQTLVRTYSTNRKMYEVALNKREILQNYYFSLEDSDSPCKIRQDVFNF